MVVADDLKPPPPPRYHYDYHYQRPRHHCHYHQRDTTTKLKLAELVTNILLIFLNVTTVTFAIITLNTSLITNISIATVITKHHRLCRHSKRHLRALAIVLASRVLLLSHDHLRLSSPGLRLLYSGAHE